MSLLRATSSLINATGRLAVIGALVLGSLSARAASGWTDFGTISRLNQQPSTGAGADMVFFTLSNTANPSGCSAGNCHPVWGPTEIDGLIVR
jgi:hypothetical protein